MLKEDYAWLMVKYHEEISGHPPDSQTPRDPRQKVLASFSSLPDRVSQSLWWTMGGFSFEVLSFICEHPCVNHVCNSVGLNPISGTVAMAA